MRSEGSARGKTAWLFVLAALFTVGLTFASLELPYRADRFLQQHIRTPDGDSHASDMARFKAELFIEHYHLRLYGYLCFTATLLLVVVGFASRKTGLATLGAMAFMLPVFAQFASVMFFLAGLGFLNVIWLPILDVSWATQELARVIRIPYDLLAWLLRQLHLDPYWPIVLLFIGGGLLLFFLGTSAWLVARSHKRDVADFWVYRFSRHPQYAGWILWSYGVYLLLMRGVYPKRSWGIDASLPWMLSTLLIIAVALLEELHMRRHAGASYEAYRSATPFLFPMPRAVSWLFSLPLRLLFKKDVPERKREIIAVLFTYALLLAFGSAFLYGSGLERSRRLLMSTAAKSEAMEELITRLRESPDRRECRFLAAQLASFGEPALEPLLTLLRDSNPEMRVVAADQLRRFSAPEARPALVEALGDSLADVRGFSVMALAKIGAMEDKEPILALLQDPEGWVQNTVITSLAQLGAQEVVPFTIQALGTAGEWQRIVCIDALGTLAAPEAVPILIDQLRNDSPRVRRAAAIALLRIGSPAAREALERAREDEDWETRVYVSEAIERLHASSSTD